MRYPINTGTWTDPFIFFILLKFVFIKYLCIFSLSKNMVFRTPSQVVNALLYFLIHLFVSVHGDVFSNLVVLVCADFQVIRRFTECKLVSVYSPGGKMSIIIYLVGVSFYAALPLTSVSGTDFSKPISCGSKFTGLLTFIINTVMRGIFSKFCGKKYFYTFPNLLSIHLICYVCNVCRK